MAKKKNLKKKKNPTKKKKKILKMEETLDVLKAWPHSIAGNLETLKNESKARDFVKSGKVWQIRCHREDDNLIISCFVVVVSCAEFL